MDVTVRRASSRVWKWTMPSAVFFGRGTKREGQRGGDSQRAFAAA